MTQIEVKGRGIPSGTCEIEMPVPFCLVVFGASGDLTMRKILPAVYNLYRNGLLPEGFFIMGSARTAMDDAGFRARMKEAVREASGEDFVMEVWEKLEPRLYYRGMDYGDKETYAALGRAIEPIEKKHRTEGNRMFYLAVPPTAYEEIIDNLGESGIAREKKGFRHVVIEKPFGRDLDSSMRLNATLRRHFRESQIYRMDHYLAKETVQDVLIFRFANSIFEPIWNRRYIEHVQITAAESLGVEHRSGYYEKAGVLRDMFQNHIFQLLALTAMEPPSIFEADRVRDEKVKVFRSIRPMDLDRLGDEVVLGQYGAGEVGGRRVRPYREEPGVGPASTTPTYAAMRLFIDNWRWNGVPFYLRSGKRLSKRKAEISIHFREVPHMMFSRYMKETIAPNNLVLRVQPDEGINLLFQTKQTGTKLCLNPVLMDFSYPKGFKLDSYERVLLDCMQGDQMLFVREDGANQTWAFLSPVIERLEAATRPDEFPNYGSGSEGPERAAALMERDGRSWRPL